MGCIYCFAVREETDFQIEEQKSQNSTGLEKENHAVKAVLGLQIDPNQVRAQNTNHFNIFNNWRNDISGVEG